MAKISTDPSEFTPQQVVKRTDLHAAYRGQQQGGIVTPAEHPVVFAITGKSGRKHGYKDYWATDGTFRYYGEGQEGDMEFTGGNRAIRDHVEKGERLFLWERLESKKTHLKLVTECSCVGRSIEQGKDKNGDTRNVIVFHLKPVSELPVQLEGALEASIRKAKEKPKVELQESAFGGGPSKQRQVTTTARDRNPNVIVFVLLRADGYCEGCGNPAPFQKPNGDPYLEVHHVEALADDGPDSADNAVAICPNCHRRAHHSADKLAFKKQLIRRIKNLSLH